LGTLIIGLPLAIITYIIFGELMLALAIIIPYVSHVVLDYLCIFEAYPLDPLTRRIVKREGIGIFYPDTLWRSSNSNRWISRVRMKGYRAVSENFFTLGALVLFVVAVYVSIA